jgi:phenylpropionate dioxygenase-like ring-hydroxylating dioxygenase large terminal subunit
MTNLSTVSSLVASTAQLPVEWYLSDRIVDLEKRILFDQGPGYIGHEMMVPNQGDYYTLDWLGNAKSLVRNQNGVELVSNVCRHRQSILLKGRGNAKNIVCPLHRWTYALDGKLLGAPHFAANPCLDLAKTPIQNWNGLLFAGQRDISADLKDFARKVDFDFSGYVLDRVQVDEYNFNWKTFIEVYLEDYHVESYHPGLNNFVDCNDLTWELSDWHSSQIVGVNSGLAKPGTPVYQKWHDEVLKQTQAPKYGAIWAVYYPNLMLEWYPNVLVVSTVLPRGPQKCVNIVEFYYPEEIALFEREFVEAQQAAYEETAIEDEEICLLMDEGRKALYEQGINEVGPYQSPMEDGLQHFHEFIRRQLEPNL